MSNQISGSNDTLMRQAQMTAEQYLAAAVEAVNQQFGSGAAATYPQIVSAYMTTAALDYGASVIARAIENHADHSSAG